jgi:hypothetical protein
MMPSLCETCGHVREIRTARSRVLLCQLSLTDAADPKYPPQPVVRCDGDRPRDDADEGEPPDRGEDDGRSG